MTVAKTNEAHALLVTCFFTRKTAKTYHALVHGVPTPLPGAEAGGGAKEGHVCGRVDGYPAHSSWRTLETFGAGAARSHASPVASLVQVPPPAHRAIARTYTQMNT